MPQYMSPGVYVEEVPSAIKAIAGVSTSTAGFIGTFGGAVSVPGDPVTDANVGNGDGAKKVFDLPTYPVSENPGTYRVRVNGVPVPADEVTLENDDVNKVSQVTFDTAPTPVAPATTVPVTVDYLPLVGFKVAPVSQPKLCTNFTEFKRHFGDFSTDRAQRNLAHAVYGFFNNGGSRCYVMRLASPSAITVNALGPFEAIDEIAIVAAPGVTSDAARDALVTHCRVRTQDRFLILDSGPDMDDADGFLDTGLFKAGTPNTGVPPNTDFAAFYFPWIRVFDPAIKALDPAGDGLVYAPPSGHVAGIYARVDTERGVHKAPANEVVLGALGLRYSVSKAVQDGLNPQGVNVIREMNGNIRVWGARTVGGDANADLKYINVRRTLLFLRESIDEGTQWVVFEPNTAALWQKITRNVTAFLLNVWRTGALFGNTPAEAFYVKCDAETNPPELRELGQVVTEIGVAIVRPAEFVIFRISQWTAPGK
ncbi:MAG TPA: phage tail sheath C-terminal domain-containing protein [Pyrinomonadaceae bacterium]|nr:phage tail sheath C-terminal domain-containing protein [Pyrinomonadaceae bacterium]